jgi:acetylornithine deacetylase/succinyl-diaminopimelate desuccinylase-like protein
MLAVRLALALILIAGASGADVDPTYKKLSHDIFQQLIEINTTDSVGSTTVAAEAMAQRLRDAGFAAKDIAVLGPNSRKGNLVARLHGTGAHKPILFMGHLDVVEARREDWTYDPFKFLEKDGYYYGRGTQDMKSGDAVLMTTFIRLKKEGYKPDRDLILMLTADEEGGLSNGADWLVKNHRDLVDAEFAINHDGGGVYTIKGKPLLVSVDATEKTYGDYQLTARNPGGHSSLPVPDNAIYHIADALARLEHYQFPLELNGITRAYFEKSAGVSPAAIGADMREVLKASPDAEAVKRLSTDPINNSTLHTTCVATRLEAGHANNALPQMARANVNCRILPGHAKEEVRQELMRVFADPTIQVRYVADNGEATDTAPDQAPAKPEPLRADVLKPLEKIADKMWPSAPVVPTMATGASDAIYTNPAGIPTYGVSGIAVDLDDIRAHGKDERVRVSSFYDGVAMYYLYIKALTGGQ